MSKRKKTWDKRPHGSGGQGPATGSSAASPKAPVVESAPQIYAFQDKYDQPHSYLRKLVRLCRVGALEMGRPGNPACLYFAHWMEGRGLISPPHDYGVALATIRPVRFVDVVHESHCGLAARKCCDCDPDIYAYAQPDRSDRQQLTEVRQAQVTPSQLLRVIHDQIDSGGRSTAEAAKTPCGGCRECCWYHRVGVSAEDDRTHLTVDRDGDGDFLRKRADGACVHLGETGCAVYEHRPRACRQYDCRLAGLARIVDIFDQGHYAPPIWLFTPEDAEDRAVELAAKMAASTGYVSFRESVFGGSVRRVDAGLCEILLPEIQKHLPEARQKIAEIDALPPEQKQRAADELYDKTEQALRSAQLAKP